MEYNPNTSTVALTQGGDCYSFGKSNIEGGYRVSNQISATNGNEDSQGANNIIVSGMVTRKFLNLINLVRVIYVL